MRGPSIRVLLFVVNIAVFFFAGSFLRRRYTTYLEMASLKQAESDLIDTTRVIALFMEKSQNFQFPSQKSAALRLSLINKNGDVLADTHFALDSLDNHKSREEVNAIISGSQIATATRFSQSEQAEVVYCAIKVRLASSYPDEKSWYILRASSPVQHNLFYTTKARQEVALISIIVFAAILFVTITLSLVISHQLHMLLKMAREYAAGNFLFKSRTHFMSEFSAISGAISEMAASVNKLQTVRKDFVANVSHELKTPITSIMGFSETLLESDLDETEYNFVDIIYHQSRRLNTIIDDLLMLSRLESDSYKPALAPQDIVSITQDILSTFTLKSLQKRIALSFIGDGEVICDISLELWTIAIDNLITNALKYCPVDSVIEVKVIAGKTCEKKPRRVATVIVEDNGDGIPAEYQSRVFERFFRVDKGRSRKMGGTGLGLSIVKHIVDLHGGKIWVQNRQDGKKGASFVIIIPSNA